MASGGDMSDVRKKKVSILPFAAAVGVVVLACALSMRGAPSYSKLLRSWRRR
jgi:hypothetical protein